MQKKIVARFLLYATEFKAPSLFRDSKPDFGEVVSLLQCVTEVCPLSVPEWLSSMSTGAALHTRRYTANVSREMTALVCVSRVGYTGIAGGPHSKFYTRLGPLR